MQSNSTKGKFVAIYYGDAPMPDMRKRLPKENLKDRIERAITKTCFQGSMLRVDSKVKVDGAATFTTTGLSIAETNKLISRMNPRTILTIHMRLSDECLDRWLEWPVGGGLVRLPVGTPFGFRLRDGKQTETAVWAKPITMSQGHDGGRTTHIYIPSTDSREIPIYPCEPYTPKKADPKSWSQMLPVDPEAEVQSQPGKVDFKPFGGGMLTISKAVAERITNGVEAIIKAGRIGSQKDFIEGVNGQTFNFGGFRDGGIVPQATGDEIPAVVTSPFVVRNTMVEESVERLWAKLGMKLPMTMRSDMLTVGRWLKEEGFTCQEWVDYLRSVKRPDSLGEPVRERTHREWETFPNPTAETIRVVGITLGTDPIEDSAMQFSADGKVYHSTTEQLATLVTEAMKKPELREAVFKKLASDLDRETLTAIFQGSRGALFKLDNPSFPL